MTYRRALRHAYEGASVSGHPSCERKRMKRSSKTRPPRRDELARLEDIPNVGPAIAADLRRLGITTPSELPGRDPYAMYDDLCRITGQRHDPCLLDTFIAVVRYMEGGPKKPWWKYTAERKRELAIRLRSAELT